MRKSTACRHDHNRKFVACDLIGETFSLLIVWQKLLISLINSNNDNNDLEMAFWKPCKNLLYYKYSAGTFGCTDHHPCLDCNCQCGCHSNILSRLDPPLVCSLRKILWRQQWRKEAEISLSPSFNFRKTTPLG
jgi:hypothetical protein